MIKEREKYFYSTNTPQTFCFMFKLNLCIFIKLHCHKDKLQYNCIHVYNIRRTITKTIGMHILKLYKEIIFSTFKLWIKKQCIVNFMRTHIYMRNLCKHEIMQAIMQLRFCKSKQIRVKDIKSVHTPFNSWTKHNLKQGTRVEYE